MIGPLLIPAAIAFGMLAIVVVFASALASQRWRRLVIILALLAFLPLCSGVYNVLYPYLYGVGSYENYEAVGYGRVYRYLPEGATDLTIDNQPTGFRAKFSLGPKAFADWFERHWEKYGGQSEFPREDVDRREPVDPEFFAETFRDLGWPPPSDAIQYNGPIDSRGAGFTIWYSEREGTGYQEANYW